LKLAALPAEWSGAVETPVLTIARQAKCAQGLHDAREIIRCGFESDLDPIGALRRMDGKTRAGLVERGEARKDFLERKRTGRAGLLAKRVRRSSSSGKTCFWRRLRWGRSIVLTTARRMRAV